MNCTLGDKISKETLRKFPYVRHFSACPLFKGGDVMMAQPLTIFHKNDDLAHCSVSIRTFGADGFLDTLYYTQDLKTVSAEVESGRVSVEDFKLVLGLTSWAFDQLQGAIVGY
jgi:hypothetical protein